MRRDRKAKKNNRKAIILARVSDKKQDSNEAQVVRVSDYVKFKGLTSWKTIEIEESSTKGDREKFQEVIKIIQESKEPIALLVDTVDRLQRSFKESVQLEELRKTGKIEIHFYRENLVVHKDSNSADLLRWDMAVMFARSYVLQLSDNVKRAFEQKRRNGEWTGRSPIGYQNIGEIKGKKNIIHDKKKAHLIRKMFELYATGNYSTLTIRTEILKEGLESSIGKPLALSMVDTYEDKVCPLITFRRNRMDYSIYNQPYLKLRVYQYCFLILLLIFRFLWLKLNNFPLRIIQTFF